MPCKIHISTLCPLQQMSTCCSVSIAARAFDWMRFREALNHSAPTGVHMQCAWTHTKGTGKHTATLSSTCPPSKLLAAKAMKDSMGEVDGYRYSEKNNPLLKIESHSINPLHIYTNGSSHPLHIYTVQQTTPAWTFSVYLLYILPVFLLISHCFTHIHTQFAMPTQNLCTKIPTCIHTSSTRLQQWGHGGLSLHLRALETSSNSCLLLLLLPFLLLLPSCPSVILFYFSLCNLVTNTF